MSFEKRALLWILAWTGLLIVINLVLGLVLSAVLEPDRLNGMAYHAGQVAATIWIIGAIGILIYLARRKR